MAARIALIRGALTCARPPSEIACSISRAGASRTAGQSAKRALSAANVRSVFTSAVFCESTV